VVVGEGGVPAVVVARAPEDEASAVDGEEGGEELSGFREGVRLREEDSTYGQSLMGSYGCGRSWEGEGT
jgi:hypothetical protein